MTIPSVIFVDDDPDIRPVMEQTLTLEDIPVACFADGCLLYTSDAADE